MSGASDARTALLRAYVERLQARDWDGLRELLHPDVVYRMPQTREAVHGREAYLRWNREYPDGWELTIGPAYADDSGGAMRIDVVFGGEPQTALVFVGFAPTGQITDVTDWWPEPYDPPADRGHLAERY